MENTVKNNAIEANVTKVNGSIVSDQILSKVDTLVSQATELGSLRTENSNLRNKLTEKAIELNKKESTITVQIEKNRGKFSYWDPYLDRYGIKDTYTISNINTVTGEDITKFADTKLTIDNDKLRKEVKELNKSVEDLNEKHDEKVKSLIKNHNEEIKSLNESLDSKIESAERKNLKIIDSLKLQLKNEKNDYEVNLNTRENEKNEMLVIINKLNNDIYNLKRQVEFLKEKDTPEYMESLRTRICWKVAEFINKLRFRSINNYGLGW